MPECCGVIGELCRTLYGAMIGKVGSASNDPMAQVVELLRPHMLGWKRIVARGDWGIRFPADDAVAFGLITFDRCELHGQDHAPIGLAKGDYLLRLKPSE